MTLFLEIYHPVGFHSNTNKAHLTQQLELEISGVPNWGRNENLQDGRSPGTGLDSPALAVESGLHTHTHTALTVDIKNTFIFQVILRASGFLRRNAYTAMPSLDSGGSCRPGRVPTRHQSNMQTIPTGVSWCGSPAPSFP